MVTAVEHLARTNLVAEIGVVTPSGRPFDLEWLPDGRTKLLFRLLEGDREGDVWVGGPRTRALLKTKSGLTRSITVRLAPGWTLPLLGVTARELTDRLVPLEALWGGDGRAFSDALLRARTREQVCAVIAPALERRAGSAPQTSAGRLARRAVVEFESGETRVDAVADALGVTGRHLRRAFTENIGVSPKEFAQTLRLQRALRMGRSSRDWARIAADAGYYDQSHLIADFKRLVGLTPSAYFERSAR